MMNWDGKADRRRHRRAPVRIVSEFGDPGSEVHLETADFSAGGFSCWMEREIQPLTKLALRFEFPAFGDRPGRNIECEAIVVRCERKQPAKRFHMAAAFVGLPPVDGDHIRDYVSWHEMVAAPAAGGDDSEETAEGWSRPQG